MLEAELVAAVGQFGVAGLIGWMWLSERRTGAERERRLEEAQTRLAAGQEELSALMTVVRENTRALASLEAAQRSMVGLVEAWLSSGRRGEAGGG